GRGHAPVRQRDGRNAADGAVPDVQRGVADPEQGRDPRRPVAGGSLHHEPGDGGLFGHAAEDGRRAAAAVGRAGAHARPAVGGLMAAEELAAIDAAAIERWIRAFAAAIAEHEQELTRLDSAIGDADHGANMNRGLKAVLAKLDEGSATGPAALLKQTGMTLVSTVGGASGPLYGTFFLRMATAIGDAETVDQKLFAAALRAGVDGVVA